MKAPADGWDRDEREAIEELADELTSLQARRRDDPSIDLLRAANHDALPPNLQAAAEQRLSKDAWSRALLAGFNAMEPSAEAGLDAEGEGRLLARIRRDVAAPSRPAAWSWFHFAIAGGAAAAAIVAVLLLRPGADVPGGVPAVQPQSAVVDSRPATRFALPLEKPDVVLSLKALTWRGAGDANPLLAGLKQPLDAFRRGDYAQADREFAALEPRYPGAVEVVFYGAVARLFLDEPKRAIPGLRRAAELADDSFASRVAWYRAIAEERAGNGVEVRRQLERVCRAGGERARDGCAGLEKIGAARAPDAR